MKVNRLTQVSTIFVLFITLSTVAPKDCRKPVRTGTKCNPRREKSGRKSRSPLKNVAPYWERKPPKDRNIDAREGSDVTLYCNIKGSPDPDFHWLMNGRKLRAKKSKFLFRQHKSKLVIRNVTLNDSTDYSCVAENKFGQLNHTFNLRVLENMPLNDIEIVTRPENQTALIGDTVIFMCRSDDWPIPTVTWTCKRDSQVMYQVLKTSESNGDLVLPNVTKDDQGEYVCTIGNNKAHKTFTATLRVIALGESLPFEPLCSLHMRREVLVDHEGGCKTREPVDMYYCMGSCGRSYFTPQLIFSANKDPNAIETFATQSCKCCVGIVERLRIVEFECPFGKKKKGFFTLLNGCQCQTCHTEKNSVRQDEKLSIQQKT
ncbi:fibroblast growth factor receptor 4-like [Physella acuta]|uniref:fibroblast growth factor receptor 4-like n=1 Tax=Physella acuta TaxID=109671 RepID=UPI0027DBC9C1|nr:fibroblast growth factor receptor 4-like [Physella acuta]